MTTDRIPKNDTGHRAIVSTDPDNPQVNRAWCPACGWRAEKADYGLADAWRRANTHNRTARPIPNTAT